MDQLSNGKLGVAGGSGGGGGGGNVTQITYAPRIDARGADAGAVARIAAVMAKDKQDFAKNVVMVVDKARRNMVLGR